MTDLPTYRALLIGNWDYRYDDGGLRPLRGPKNDLEVIRSALTHPDFGLFTAGDVTVAQNLTSQDIGRAMHGFVRSGSAVDRLLIYYSGHGERVGNLRRLGLCGVDIRHEDIESDAFPSTRLREWIEQYKSATSTVVILDCCYAGQYKGGFTEDSLAESFGTGTAVLSSGGDEPVPDSQGEDDPSPFTAALAQILTRPDLSGGQKGFLDPEDVYQELIRFQPKLRPPPRRNVQAQGIIRLARREPVPVDKPAGPVAPVNYSKDLAVETIDLRFHDGRVTASVLDAGHPAEPGEPVTCDLTLLDPDRQTAVRRLASLADALAHTRTYATDPRFQHAVRKAWECIGANLYDTAVPDFLRTKIADYSVDSVRRLLKVRLSFADDRARQLERYPWEYIAAGPGPRTVPSEGDAPVEDGSLALALRPGVLIERVGAGRAGGTGSLTGTRMSTAGIVNVFEEPYAELARNTRADLQSIPGLKMLFDLSGAEATWANLLGVLDTTQPGNLVLMAPIRRYPDGLPRIGFAPNRPEDPIDWMTVNKLTQVLQDLVPLRSLSLITFAGGPGHDVVRGTFEVAQNLSSGGIQPVVFVCHLPGFERSASPSGGGAPQTFAGLLMQSLCAGNPLDRSVHYARVQVMRRIPADYETLFGVPGYYAGPEPDPHQAAASSIGAASSHGWRLKPGQVV